MFWFHHESHTESFRKIAIGFFVVSLLLIGVVFYVSFSWATITIAPKSVPLSEGFMMEVVDVPAQQLSAGQISGRIVEQDMEVKGTFSASGETAQAVEKSRGVITLINQSSKNQQLRATTRIQAPDGTLFRTTQYSLVPAGGQIDVPVVADTATTLGDLTSTRFILPGLHKAQQLLIYGVGFAPTVSSGGLPKLVTQADIDAAQQSLQDELKQKATDSLAAQTSSTAVILNPVSVISVKPVTIAKSADVNEKVDHFVVRMSAHVTAIVYDRDALKSAVTKQLLVKLGPGYDLLPPTDTDIVTEVENFDAASKKATLKIVAHAGRVRNADSVDFDKSNLSGLSAESIRSYFRAFDDIATVSVQFTPFWVTSAPYLTDHIHILIKK